MVGERRALQIAVLLACAVPIGAGLAGVYYGAPFLVDQPSSALHDSHFRYLSGLLLAIGFAYLGAVPNIERHAGRFRLLTLIVVTGGLARLAEAFLAGSASNSVVFALVMELVVTFGFAPTRAGGGASATCGSGHNRPDRACDAGLAPALHGCHLGAGLADRAMRSAPAASSLDHCTERSPSKTLTRA